jgi:secreted PhoX family phosphatase
MVAVTLPNRTEFTKPGSVFLTLPFPEPAHLPDYVKDLVQLWTTNTLPAGLEFPLANATSDDVRALQGLHHNVVVSWLDPLVWDDGTSRPRFGSNCDYLAYFGDGWNAIAGDPPQWHGSGTAGMMWSNFEYISNTYPTTTSAPTGGHLTLALWLRDRGILTNDVRSNVWTQADVDTYVEWNKRQIGGGWFKVIQDPATGDWSVDRRVAAQRYDSTSATQLLVTGQPLNSLDHDDAGAPLPPGVVAGIAGDCSGGQTPWGTVFSGEENVQDYYGDLEACWSSTNAFVAGQGFDAGANIAPTFAAETATSEYGRHSNPNQRHERDTLGYLVEIDPGVAPGEYLGKTTAGVGHRKMGAFGRVRWENVTFHTDANWRLVSGQPIVMYGADDRRGGRILKWVSGAPYVAGMTRAQIRALLDTGALYVSQFDGLDNANGRRLLATGLAPTEAVPGIGRWIRLSTTNVLDDAVNAPTLGPGTKVGAALQNVTWNSIGGFADDDDVRTAVFTACNKIGIMELNRPEDLEWNPRDPSGTPRLYVAFTNYSGRTCLNQAGVVDNATQRSDRDGAVWALQEANPISPAGSLTFTYLELWAGTQGTGPYDASSPDNIAIDGDGGVWFGTDGNFGRSATADALYYLDLDPAHKVTPNPSFGRNFRVAACPSDSEATGPCFASDMRTLFFNAQHPGEGATTQSTWPQAR